MSKLFIRPLVAKDMSALLTVWHRGWHDAHTDLVPSEILRFRQPAHFSTWYDDVDETICVALADDVLVGFYGVVKSELSKLYVDREMRGSTAARDLIVHAETALKNNGVKAAELF